jgi:hypothetical protein
VERQNVGLVNTALVVGAALCEVGAIMGIIDRLAIRSGADYLLFLIAAIGIAFHMPRREQLLAASYKTSTPGATA